MKSFTAARFLAAALTILFASTGGALAMEPLAPVRQQMFTCAIGPQGLSKVAYRPGGQGCCSPTSHCVEMLSTTILSHEDKTGRI